MAPVLRRAKSKPGQGRSRLELVVFTQHLRGFLDEPDRLFPDAVVMSGMRWLPFRQKTEHIANARRLIAGSWGRIIHKTNEALWKEVNLVQLPVPHPRGR